MSEYNFDPLFNTFEQQVARNLADSIYSGIEYGVHYVVIPAAYVGYKTIKWCFSTSNNNVVAQPAAQQPERGFFNRLVTGSWRGLKTIAKIVTPGIVSDYAYRAFLQHTLWPAIKPFTTAVMRPWLERMVPYFSRIYGESNFVLKVRNWMPFNEDASFTRVNIVFWHLKNIVHRNDCNYELSKKAYLISEQAAEATFSTLQAARDILWGVTQIPEFIAKKGITQNINDVMNYAAYENQYTMMMVDGAKNAVGFTLSKTLELTKNAFMWGAEGLSDAVEYGTGWSIPAQHIYYGAVGGAAAVALATAGVTALLGAKLAHTAATSSWRRLNDHVAGLNVVPAAQFLLNWGRHNPPIAINVQHQQPVAQPAVAQRPG